MPRYTVMIVADHTGTAHRIQIDAPTPWLALERSQAMHDWIGAEVFEGGRSLGKVDRLSLPHRGLWKLHPAARPVAEPAVIVAAEPATSEQLVQIAVNAE